MKKKIFMFVMAFAIIFPVAFLLSACGEKKSPEVTETGISVYGKPAGTYGDYA